MRCVGHIFDSKTHEPNPAEPSQSIHLSSKQKICLCRAEKQKAKSKSKSEFQYGFEIPRKWDNIIRIDTAADNILWQDSVNKEVGALLHHKYFYF